MATTKVPVDHSALSGAPPKGNSPGDGSFLEAAANALKKEGVDVAAPAKGVLGKIQKGRQFEPPRVLLVGTEGIGKSTWAAAAPNAIFVPTEDGLGQIDCEKFPLAKTYQDVVEALTGLATEPHHYQTVAIDSVDWLERLIWDNVCRRTNKRNIEDIGYAKGYTFALDEWREVIGLLSRCRAKGMAVILIAHSKVEKFEDPENPAYDQYVPRLHKHAQALISEWVDAILFATRKRTVKLVEGKNTDERPIGIPVGADGGTRVIRTVDSPTAKAKNRYGLPPEIPLSWPAFAEGLDAFMNQNEKKGA